MVRINPSLKSPNRRRDGARHFAGTDWDLLETQRNIMKNELRIWLLRSLLSKGLATRDIYYFALGQVKQ